MGKYRIHIIITATSLAMLGLIFIQAHWIRVMLEENNQKFKVQVTESIIKVSERLQKQEAYELMGDKWIVESDATGAVKLSIIEDLAAGFSVDNKPLIERAEPNTLRNFLDEELKARGIKISYHLGIKDTKSDSFIYLYKTENIKALEKSEFKTALFASDIFTTPGYLAITFPDKNLFLLKRIIWMLMLSGIFITMIIYSFVWMVNNLLRHKKLSEMKTDFINNMTHELKTPISTISLAAQALRDESLQKSPEMIKRFTGIIADENNRLQGQVERVLQMAKLERGQLKLEREEVNIEELIMKVVGSLRLRVEEVKGSLNFEPGLKNPYVWADKMHMMNIISNLIDNAIKYTTNPPEISIYTKEINNCIAIEFIDNGIGLTPEEQAKIFDKFYRVPTGNVHDVKGFGLGLSYVKTIANAHGGKVEVKSAPGRGSTFTVLLPTSKP